MTFPSSRRGEERGEWSPFSNMLPQWDILTLTPSPSPYVFFRDKFNRSSAALYTMWPILKVYCIVWKRAMQMWNMHEIVTGLGLIFDRASYVLGHWVGMWSGGVWRGCLQKGGRAKGQKNNIRYSNVVPHRSTNLTRSCLTSLSRREAVLSWLYGRSCHLWPLLNPWSHHKRIHFIPLIHRTISNSQNDSPSHAPSPFTYPIILQPPFLPHTHLQPNAQHKIHTATLWSMLSYHQ